MYYHLRKNVLEANKKLGKTGLVKLNWGNISEIDRAKKVVAIKPSGVDYNKLRLKDIPVVDINGKVLYGKLKPSSDLKTHLEIYKNFQSISGICHTHSKYATIFCQSSKEIPCIGTTHADYFFGTIPVTRKLKKKEIENSYVKNTGRVIIETFRKKKIDVKKIPAILVKGHGPFTLGINAKNSLEISVVLEEVAETTFKSLLINNKIEFSKSLLKEHFFRKNGIKRSYGQ